MAVRRVVQEAAEGEGEVAVSRNTKKLQRAFSVELSQSRRSKLRDRIAAADRLSNAAARLTRQQETEAHRQAVEKAEAIKQAAQERAQAKKDKATRAAQAKTAKAEKKRREVTVAALRAQQKAQRQADAERKRQTKAAKKQAAAERRAVRAANRARRKGRRLCLARHRTVVSTVGSSRSGAVGAWS